MTLVVGTNYTCMVSTSVQCGDSTQTTDDAVSCKVADASDGDSYDSTSAAAQKCKLQISFTGSYNAVRVKFGNVITGMHATLNYHFRSHLKGVRIIQFLTHFSAYMYFCLQDFRKISLNSSALRTKELTKMIPFQRNIFCRKCYVNSFLVSTGHRAKTFTHESLSSKFVPVILLLSYNVCKMRISE